MARTDSRWSRNWQKSLGAKTSRYWDQASGWTSTSHDRPRIYERLISGLAAAAMMVLLVWLHLVAAVSWIGGTIFLSVVLVPVLKREPFASQRALLFRTIARRFRALAWGAITVLLFTGPLLLHQREIPIADPSEWPMVLATKLGLVAILLFLTLTHDLILGPRVGRILQLPAESRSRFDQALVVWSPWVARCLLSLALAILLAAVMLVRT